MKPKETANGLKLHATKKNPDTLYRKAIAAGLRFFISGDPNYGDPSLVSPHHVDIGPITKPQAHGNHEYSGRIVTAEENKMELEERIAKAKVVWIGCMDYRLQTMADEIAAKEQVKPEEVLVLQIGGGMMQPGKKEKKAGLYEDSKDPRYKREKGVQNIIRYILETKAHALESKKPDAVPFQKIYYTGHTSDLQSEDLKLRAGCGGGRHFAGGGLTLAEAALASEHKEELAMRYSNYMVQDHEFWATSDPVRANTHRLFKKLNKLGIATYDDLFALSEIDIMVPSKDIVEIYSVKPEKKKDLRRSLRLAELIPSYSQRRASNL